MSQRELKLHNTPDLHPEMALVFALLWGPGDPQLLGQVRVGGGSGQAEH